MKASVLHNPRCSKSRETVALLEANDVDVELLLYLQTPPPAAELAAACAALGVGPLGITRTKEPLFKELGLSPKDARTDAEWFAILASNPKLIERPIVKIGERYAIGRPPENVLALLTEPV